MITKIKNSLHKIYFYETQKGVYQMINTKDNSIIGNMSISLRQNELFIDSLYIKKNMQRKGFGTIFLEFAKLLSKKMGKKGHLKCMAAALGNNTNIPPHIFYRKHGFDAFNKEALQKIDEAIESKRQVDLNSFPIMYMYYPSEK